MKETKLMYLLPRVVEKHHLGKVRNETPLQTKISQEYFYQKNIETGQTLIKLRLTTDVDVF